MIRRAIGLLGCILFLPWMLIGCTNEQEAASSLAGGFSSSAVGTENQSEPHETLQIRVMSDSHSVVFALNDSLAAKSLYNQLPLTLPVENYSTNEKIFYPPEKLDISDTPPAKGPAGTLAYYEPWGDVVMFYDECSGASGLYALGEAVAGKEQIQGLTGDIRIEKMDS